MSFREFDSADEMFDFMHQQEEAANARVTPEQAQIGYGAFWMRPYDDLLIFGHVPTAEETEASERALGADDEEIEYQRESFADAYNRGYRYGKCYSVVEPEGEWGSTHIANMIEITEQQFNQARDFSWSLELLVEDDRTRPWLERLLRVNGLL
jgi:hypothetical protein